MSEPSWADLFRLLSGMSRLLQSSPTEAEMLDVMDWYLPRMLPGAGGAVHLFADADAPAGSLLWGDPGPAAEPPAGEDRAALRSGPELLAPDRAAGRDKALLTIPLGGADRLLGVLQLAAERAEDLEAAQGLALVTAEHLALTVENLRIRTRLNSLAVKDALTGLFNRRHFDETLNRETRAAAASGAPLSVIMFDIDHFKVLNDTKGHDAGDAALRSVGAFLGSLAEKDVIPCRYGGEEFFLVLRGRPYGAALELAERVRLGIAALDIRHQAVQVSPIHVSVGVAAFPGHGDTPDALAKAADDCLYVAKENGRNRVVGREDLPSA